MEEGRLAKLLEPGLDFLEDFVGGVVENAVGLGESAVVKAGFVRAGFPFDVGGLGVVGEEPLGTLRPEDGEGGDAEGGSEVAGSGVVADEGSCVFQTADEFGEVGGAMGKVAEGFPFLFLMRVAEDLGWPAYALEAGGEVSVAGDWPDANGLGGAGVKKDEASGGLAGWRMRRAAEGKAERLAEGFPLRGAVCVGMDLGEWFGEEELAT